MRERPEKRGRRVAMLGTTHGARAEPWRRWGNSLSIAYCTGLLLMQGVVIVHSLGLDLPVDLSALARAGGIVLALVALLSINRMPKLPWLERAWPFGELGPVYGPRYLRLTSRAVVVFMIMLCIGAIFSTQHGLETSISRSSSLPAFTSTASR